MGGSVLVFIRKSGRVGENSTGAAKLGGPVVHHLYETVHGSAYMLRYLQGDVVGGGKKHGVQALFNGKYLSKLGGNIRSAVRYAGNSGVRHGDLIGELRILQSQKRCHDFYCSSGEKLLIRILCIQNRIGGIFHDYGGSGGDLRSLGPSCNTVGRNAGRCGCAGGLFCGRNRYGCRQSQRKTRGQDSGQ